MNQLPPILWVLLTVFAGGRQSDKPQPTTTPLVLRGIVEDTEGRPLANARVVARAEAVGTQELPVSISTDASGRFQLQLKKVAPHTLYVLAEGYAPWTEEKVQPGKALTIVLQESLSIEGIVRDGGNLEPIAGARVESRVGMSLPSEPRLGIIETTTGDDGRFRLDGFGPGRHSLTATAPGYGRASRDGVPPGGSIELFLFPGSSIVGTVVDVEDRPLRDAHVQAEIERRDMFRPFSTGRPTDERGRFELTGLEPGKYRLVVRHPDFAPAVVPPLTVGKLEDIEIEVVLFNGAKIHGRLVDIEERPVQGTVEVESLDDQETSRRLPDLLRVETSADGQFVFDRLPPGSHRLAARAPAFAPLTVEVPVGSRQAEVDLGDIVLETGLAVRGRVVDEKGGAIAGAQLIAVSRSGGIAALVRGERRQLETTSDAKGSFVLAGLSPGNYMVRVRAPGYGTFMMDSVDAGSVDVEVVMKRAGAIRGNVIAPDGTPVPSCMVRARSHDRRGGGSAYDRGSPDGVFLLEDLPEGTYVVEIEAPDWQPEVMSDIEVVPGEILDLGKIRLEKGGIIRGTVVDPSGVGVAGADVRLVVRAPTLPPGSAAVTDADGAFELRGVPEGPAEVAASHPNYADGRVSGLMVDPEMGPSETQVVLTWGGKLEGYVRDRDGMGIGGRTVELLPVRHQSSFSFNEGLRAPTDGDGHFVIARVPAGRANVTLYQSAGTVSFSIQTQEVEIREGELAWVEFLSREVLVEGRVSRNRVPAAGIQLMLIPREGGNRVVSYSSGSASSVPAAGVQPLNAVTREDGSFELLVELPGEYGVSAMSLDGKVHLPSKTLEIPDVDTHRVDLDYSGTLVTGRVIDEETEEPIRGATVLFRSSDPGSMGAGSTETVEDGFFQLEIEPGDYRLSVMAEGYGSVTTELTVGATPPPEITVSLPVARTLRGRVVDAMGRAAVGARVAASAGEDVLGSMSMALADGSFQLDRLADQRYNLLAFSEPAGFAFLPGVRPGGADVELVLQPGGLLQVAVLDGNREPVRGAAIRLSAVAGYTAAGWGGGPTDASGRIEMNAPAGPVELTVRKDTAEAKVVVEVPQGGTVPVQVLLEPDVR